MEGARGDARPRKRRPVWEVGRSAFHPWRGTIHSTEDASDARIGAAHRRQRSASVGDGLS